MESMFIETQVIMAVDSICTCACDYSENGKERGLDLGGWQKSPRAQLIVAFGTCCMDFCS